MFIHPEMRETLRRAMEDGLRYWKDKTPEQIRQRLHTQTLAEQKAFMPVNLKQGLAFRMVAICKCPTDPFGGKYHFPDCSRETRAEFYTPEPEQKKPGTPWGFHQPVLYSPPIFDEELDEEEGL